MCSFWVGLRLVCSVHYQPPIAMLVPEDEIRALTSQSVDTIVEHSKFYKEADRLLVVITPGYYLEVTEYAALILAIAHRLYKENPPTVELWEDKQFAMKFDAESIKLLLRTHK